MESYHQNHNISLKLCEPSESAIYIPKCCPMGQLIQGNNCRPFEPADSSEKPWKPQIFKETNHDTHLEYNFTQIKFYMEDFSSNCVTLNIMPRLDFSIWPETGIKLGKNVSTKLYIQESGKVLPWLLLHNTSNMVRI